jgi:dienelactone hydrolase
MTTPPVDRDDRRGAVTRRALLRSAAVAGGSLAAATAVPGTAFAKGPRSASGQATPLLPDPAPGIPSSIGMTFFTDPALDFNARFALGAAGYHCADVGEVVTAINAANAAGGTIPSFVTAFSSLADRTGAYASQTRAVGHRATAREAHLRAAEYYAQALFFVLGTDQPSTEPDLYALGRRHWDAAARLFEPAALRVRIPYEQMGMPGWFLRPDASGTKRPTVIVNNGSDGQVVEAYAYGAAAAVERGWNALLFDGPGQGSMLFEHEIPFRPDWEKVVTPVVDWLRERSDVDPDRIALTGWSMGGELVVRAAAFEPRLAAVVSDPGSYDIWLAWPENVRTLAASPDPAEVNREWQSIISVLTPDEAFDVKKRGEIFGREFLHQARRGEVPTDLALLAKRIQEYHLTAVADRVKPPVLVTDYELEQFYPGQARQLYEMLPGRKDYVTFDVSQGAEYHCAPMAPQFRNEVVFDWLDDTVAKPR